MAKELKIYKDKVERVLELFNDARNDDLVLLARYVNHFRSYLVHRDDNGRAYVYLDDMNSQKMPPSQTLANCRKIIQNHEGKLLPTDPAVIKRRKIKEENIKNAEWREAKDKPTPPPAPKLCPHGLPLYVECPSCPPKAAPQPSKPYNDE